MTEAFFSFLLDPADLVPVLFLGDPLDFRDEGDPLELDGSGEIWGRCGFKENLMSWLLKLSDLVYSFNFL